MRNAMPSARAIMRAASILNEDMLKEDRSNIIDALQAIKWRAEREAEQAQAALNFLTIFNSK